VTPSSAIAAASSSLPLAVAPLFADTPLRERRAHHPRAEKCGSDSLRVGSVDDRMPSLVDIEERLSGGEFGRVARPLRKPVALRQHREFA
jgi:hypothetical protein